MKPFKYILNIAVTFSIVLGASFIAAQENKRPMMRCEENFVKMDTNKDGKVNLAEFSAVKHPRGNAEELFKERDADKDGLLTKEEFCSQGAMRGNRRGKGN